MWAPVRRAPVVACPKSPCVFQSVAIVQFFVLALGSDFGLWFDGLKTATAPLPAGLASFADVAGGQTLTGAEGTQYIVGATRDGTPTDKVLVVGADAKLSSLTLLAPRAGRPVDLIPRPTWE